MKYTLGRIKKTKKQLFVMWFILCYKLLSQTVFPKGPVEQGNTTEKNSLLRSATTKRKSALQLNSFNANNSNSVEPISKHWRKNNYNTYQCNRSKDPPSTLCAQTNAQPDYATLSRRLVFVFVLSRLRQSRERTYM